MESTSAVSVDQLRGAVVFPAPSGGAYAQLVRAQLEKTGRLE